VRAKDRNYGACSKPSCHDPGNNDGSNQSGCDHPRVHEYVTSRFRHVAS
jgi:hypothetical protein